MTELGKPSIWAEFGLAGLVIFALFCLIVYLLREHKSERKDWKDTSTKQSEKVTAALVDLKDVIHRNR